MFPVSNYDVLVIVAVSGAIQIGGLIALGVMAVYSHRTLAQMLTESQRLTRVVGALVIQEEQKTRDLFRDP